jgi:predicted lipoprotein
MSTVTEPKPQAPTLITRRTMVIGAIAVVVVAAIALDTKVVQIGSEHDVRKAVFSPETYGVAEYPKVKANVEERAVPAAELATAITASKAEAGKKFGIATSTGPVISVTFKGIVGEKKGNTHTIAVEGLPEGLQIRVQTGPAINGTDLRDATGTIEFGQFKNQIEYQDAGSALNNEVKKQVLAPIDMAALTGKTVSVVGVFKLINPKNWLVTPVRLEVQ